MLSPAMFIDKIEDPRGKQLLQSLISGNPQQMFTMLNDAFEKLGKAREEGGQLVENVSERELGRLSPVASVGDMQKEVALGGNSPQSI